ncbi:bifunctional diaminohydroxyphosphoribosylaminopyrimidine deaminase/5-amino-6-(5-phosphoribosylamino)uracil reductase RibD [Flavobacterium kingsejongi]|uniref:Riboflavin biosynthesis protein RibD n=1 Tax=Flavobacterium kingsejongi TaxID=1678728 RepID=A0A2S1LTW5_9FLAO|nr:bifunctional diaminohydroxyphosphoribosylaminopyrimidine deaminase/5-amino-6-(5-phosphoribosylamino)uracil reductase RibD [Flavobacterium kingsejongi]AWG27203.1 riboflavin biosynthesis protein RibD [Flavobacterium kingsejongi]
MKIHQKYLDRCIALAKNGLGTTYPNPLVGSVIVYNDTIIGEGWHRKAGEPHAEVNAINSVKDKKLLSKSTIYVSLEPCSHFGKTPPCCDLIIQHHIPNVVIGTIDPFAQVSGNGIKKLIASGRNVTVGILEDAANALNKRFFTFHEQQRPYIILKWAESQDGFISPHHPAEGETRHTQDLTDKKPVWITNVYSRQLVHKWRSEEQAILVGTKTVLDDNPKLNVRDWAGKNPVRVVIDRKKIVSSTAFVLDKSTKTIVITSDSLVSDHENLCYETIDFTQNQAKQIAAILYRHEIQSVIIEGGRRTLQSFIDAGIWDEARVFKGNLFLGEGTKAPTLNKPCSEKQSILKDQLLLYYNHDQYDNL